MDADKETKQLSKEERRALALQKLARVFGSGSTNGSTTSHPKASPEVRVLEEVLRCTAEPSVVQLVQDRLNVLRACEAPPRPSERLEPAEDGKDDGDDSEDSSSEDSSSSDDDDNEGGLQAFLKTKGSSQAKAQVQKTDVQVACTDSGGGRSRAAAPGSAGGAAVAAPPAPLKLSEKLRRLVKGSMQVPPSLTSGSYWEGLSGGALSARAAPRHVGADTPPTSEARPAIVWDPEATWQQMVADEEGRSGSACGGEADPPPAGGSEEPSAGGAAEGPLLGRRGYLVVKSKGTDEWRDRGADLEALASTMPALGEAGWPPVFLYMYDATWRVVSDLFSLAREVLECGAGEEVVLEASFFGWSLRGGGGGTDRAGTIGNNFALPHRDYTFDESWAAPEEGGEGEAKKATLVCMWVALTETSAHNGCLSLVPREFDPFWAAPRHPAHMRAATRDHGDLLGSAQDAVELRFPVSGLRQEPAPPGTVICWAGNTIHMGSACSQRAGAKPRRSIAFTFRKANAQQFATSVVPPLTISDVQSLTLERRFQLISQSLLLYSQWYSLPTALPHLCVDGESSNLPLE